MSKPASDQAELANRLIHEMEVSGDHDDCDGMTVADLLDNLACAGLRLVPDEEGIASRAYVRHVANREP